MKVNGIDFPEGALAAALRRMRAGEFDAQDVRQSMREPVKAANIYGRNAAYDAIDAAATRLIRAAAADGKIVKVLGTRRWVAACTVVTVLGRAG
jgi:hypothetical protein